MLLDPKNGSLSIEIDQLCQVNFLVLYALKNLRLTSGLTLDKYKRNGPLTSHDHAAIAIVEIAQKLGIRFEVDPHDHNKLDLRDID